MRAAASFEIEMVVPSLVTAGMEMVVCTLVRALARRGHVVGVTCTQEIGALGTKLLREGFSVQVVPAPGILTNVYPAELVRWLQTRRPQIVHVHSGVWLKSARAAHLAGRIPLVHTVHGLLDSEPWHEVWLKRLAAHYSSAIVTVSDELRDDLTDRVGVRAPKPMVIRNGIDTAVFAPRPRSKALHAKLGLAANTLLVGCVGRLAPVKNHRLLMDAFARIDNHNAHLVLVGDGELRALLEEQAVALAVRKRVHFLGEQRDLQLLLPELDVFVLSSLAEGTSISLLEAMASGLPCVATAVGGNPTVLAEGQAGRLVASRDVGALASALEELLGNPERSREFSILGRRRVCEEYSEDAMTRAYEDVYNFVLGTRGTKNA